VYLDNSINNLIKENIEINDELLKVMMIGMTKIGKTSLVNTFTGEENEEEYEPTNGIDIKKTMIRLNERNVRIEFIDTSQEIHSKELTRALYKVCNGIFYIVDNTQESIDFVKNLHLTVLASNSNASYFLINIGEDCNTNVMSFYNEFHIGYVKISDFNQFSQKNDRMITVFNKILIRKLSNTRRRSSKKRSSITKEIDPKLSSNDEYKMESFEKDSHTIPKRHLSYRETIVHK